MAPSVWFADTDNAWVFGTYSGAVTGAQQFTITTTATDFTKQYPVGTKLAWKESGTQKYGYVIASSYAAGVTTVVIGPMTDYGGGMLANPDTGTQLYSYSNPPDFPNWFNYNPHPGSASTWGFSAVPTTLARYQIQGRECTIAYAVSAGGTSSAVSYTFLAPCAAAARTGDVVGYISTDGQWVDNGGYLAAGACAVLGTGATTGNCYTNNHGGNWTASSTKYATFLLKYQV